MHPTNFCTQRFVQQSSLICDPDNLSKCNQLFLGTYLICLYTKFVYRLLVSAKEQFVTFWKVGHGQGHKWGVAWRWLSTMALQSFVKSIKPFNSSLPHITMSRIKINGWQKGVVYWHLSIHHNTSNPIILLPIHHLLKQFCSFPPPPPPLPSLSSAHQALAGTTDMR